MRRRTRLAAAVMAAAITAGTLGVLAPSAGAAPGDTAVTFSLTGGALSITVPSSAALANQVSGTANTTSGSLGQTTVNDARGDVVANWTVYVTSSDFVAPGTAPAADRTIPKANVAYTVTGADTGSSGTGILTPAALATLGVDHTPGPIWAGVGVNVQKLTPTITVTLLNGNATPTKAPAGDYAGTITQSLV
jgi:hypothetical protein